MTLNLRNAIRQQSGPIRFVVLSQPRTGSSLLTGSIRWHPQVLMQGEILNRHYQRPDLPDDDGAQRFRVALSSPDHDAVGCKMHACQPDAGFERWESAWDALADDPTVKVIHLYRRSILAQLASWRIAGQLNRWGDQTDVSERPVIEVDDGELKWFKRFNAIAYQARLNRLRHHSILPIAYESLRDDWDSMVEVVLRFIGVDPIRLEPCAIRSETRPLQHVISNYQKVAGGTDV